MKLYDRKEAAKVLHIKTRTLDRALRKMGKRKGLIGRVLLTEEEIKVIAGVK